MKNKQILGSCDFSCRDATVCMFKLVGDCYNCEKVSCENCIHFIKDTGCELQEKEERTKSFFTELIMEQNEQK